MDATEQFKTAIDLLTQAFNKNNQELVDSYIEVAKKAQKNGYLDMAVEYYARAGAAISAHAERMLPSTEPQPKELSNAERKYMVDIVAKNSQNLLLRGRALDGLPLTGEQSARAEAPILPADRPRANLSSKLTP
jgi:hypothetical protein